MAVDGTDKEVEGSSPCQKLPGRTKKPDLPHGIPNRLESRMVLYHVGHEHLRDRAKGAACVGDTGARSLSGDGTFATQPSMKAKPHRCT